MAAKNGNTYPPKIVSWKCPTTKYVSVRCRSVATVPLGGPERPPSRKTTMAPSTNSIGVGVEIFPFQIVAIHEKNFTPVGTATSRVLYMNGTWRYWFMPEANMWCAHTRKPTSAMPSDDIATHRYPYSGFRTNGGSSSEITPRPGSTKTYTA